MSKKIKRLLIALSKPLVIALKPQHQAKTKMHLLNSKKNKKKIMKIMMKINLKNNTNKWKKRNPNNQKRKVKKINNNNLNNQWLRLIRNQPIIQ